MKRQVLHISILILGLVPMTQTQAAAQSCQKVFFSTHMKLDASIQSLAQLRLQIDQLKTAGVSSFHLTQLTYDFNKKMNEMTQYIESNRIMTAAQLAEWVRKEVQSVQKQGDVLQAKESEVRDNVGEILHHTMVFEPRNVIELKSPTMFLRNAISPDGKHLVSAQDGGEIQLIDINSKKKIRTLRVGSWVSQVEFSPDGKQLYLTSSDGVARIFDLSNGKTRVVAKYEKNNLRDARISADGKFFFNFEPDVTGYKIRVVDLKTGKKIWISDENSRIAQFSPDGKMIAIVSEGKELSLCEPATGKKIKTYQFKTTVDHFSFSSDGPQLFVLSDHTNLQVISLKDFKTSYKKDLDGHTFSHGLHLSPDNRYFIVLGNDNEVIVRDMKSANKVFTFSHDQRIETAVFSPDGKFLVTTSEDGVVKITDVHSQDQLYEFSHTHSVDQITFSRDGHYLVTQDVRTLKVTELYSTFEKSQKNK
ncbi:MAG: hypothetical protein BroJett040_25290 [Oligoflexia bacterium]|nr:MAG: hypothetical protein BroJett040_25290 [Oligoflexia bacterium]